MSRAMAPVKWRLPCAALAFASHSCLWVSSTGPWPSTGGSEFSVGSWNILSPRFERDIAYHPYVSPEHRSWAYRKPLLLKRISDLDVDLLCCQEAANQQLSLVPDLEAAGYTALVPPRSKGSGGIEKPVTFYRPETFKVLASNYRSRANLHALQLVNTSAALLLANLHLQGHPLEAETRRSQLRSAFQRLHRMQKEVLGGAQVRRTAALLVGDFNDAAGSSLHRDLQLLDTPPDETAGAGHEPWPLLDAHADANASGTFRATGRSVRIDFIYHSPSLRRVALRRPLAPAEEQRLDWSMDRWPPWPQLVPNAWYPSDHVPVAASFALDDPT